MVFQALHRRDDSPTRGRHLLATRPIPKGHLIFVEKPLLSLQTLGNAHAGALVCRNCRAFVGGPDLCLQVASGVKNRDDLGVEVSTDSDEITTILYPCRHKCGELYCSQVCEHASWEYGGHELLCTGLLPDPPSSDGDNTHEDLHPLLKFKVHAVRNNEILLMVADLVATVLSLYRKQIEVLQGNRQAEQGENVVTLLELSAPYLDFSNTPWWEVATASLIASPLGFVEASQLDKTLRSLCKESSALLRDAFMELARDAHPTHVGVDSTNKNIFQLSLLQAIRDCDELFSEQFFGKIIGSFEQNAIGIRARHPLCRDILESSALRGKCHSELVACLENGGLLDNNEDGVNDEDFENDDEMDVDGTRQNQIYTCDQVDHALASLYIEEEGCGIQESKASIAEGNEMDESDGDDLDILFTPLDGTAMYQTACKMNHSCDPNVIVRYSFSRIPGGTIGENRWGPNFPLVLECIARRDIAADEELCISYVNKTRSVLERQDELFKTYGFQCNCRRCQSELQSYEIDTKPTDSYPSSVSDVFGENDEIMSEDEDDSTEIELTGVRKLNQIVKKLDGELVSYGWGVIPLPIFSNVVSYIIQNGSEIVHNFTTLVGTNDLSNTKDLVPIIQKCLEALGTRDFATCIDTGGKTEAFLLKSLFSHGSWPNHFIQKAYLICSLTAAVAYAQNLNFRIAMRMLDRAFILGLPRVELESFFDYVSYHCKFRSHAYDMLLRIISFDTVEEQPEVSSVSINHPILEVDKTNGSSSAIIEEAMKSRKPVIIRKFATTWPAIKKWRRFTFLSSEHGHRIVPIEVGDMANGMTERIMSLSSFYHDYLFSGHSSESNRPVAYLAQHSLCDQIPELLQDLALDQEFYSKDSKINMWIGTKGTRTPLHYDSLDNIFVQMSGSKYVRLYGIEETSKLYVMKNNNTYGKQGNMSAIDCEREDFQKHPLAASALYTEAILNPGDALFIPSKMWHYVRGLSKSISVNFWS